MQQIEIDAIGTEPLQACLARAAHAFAARVRWQHFAYDEYPLAHAANRFCDQRFGTAVAVHLGGIDERHAELDAQAQSSDLLLALRRLLAHVPGALTERRHRLPATQRD